MRIKQDRLIHTKGFTFTQPPVNFIEICFNYMRSIRLDKFSYESQLNEIFSIKNKESTKEANLILNLLKLNR